MTEKSAGAVVYHKKRFLLLQYEAGHWDFPKGHIEKNENERETCLREIREETGLEVDIIEGFRETIHYFYKSRGKAVRKEVIFLLAEANTEKINISHEHTGHEWLEYEKALEKITFRNSRNVLKKAYELLKQKKTI